MNRMNSKSFSAGMDLPTIVANPLTRDLILWFKLSYLTCTRISPTAVMKCLNESNPFSIISYPGVAILRVIKLISLINDFNKFSHIHIYISSYKNV
jgi:hypothetical protein